MRSTLLSAIGGNLIVEERMKTISLGFKPQYRGQPAIIFPIALDCWAKVCAEANEEYDSIFTFEIQHSLSPFPPLQHSPFKFVRRVVVNSNALRHA